MKKLIIVSGCLFLAFNTLGATPCDEVVTKISDKIKTNGVSSFRLEVVDKGSVTDRKVVGVCDEGKKDIVYERSDLVIKKEMPNEE